MRKNRKIFIGVLAAAACFFTACGLQSSSQSASQSLESSSDHYHYCKKVEAIEPTCTSEGQIEHWKCSSCEAKFEDRQAKKPLTDEQITLAMLLHTTEHIGARGGDCKDPGNIEYWTCTVCDKYFTEEACLTEVTAKEVIIPAAHTMTHHDAKSFSGKQNGNIEYWTCGYCEGYFSDVDGATKITQEDTVILAPMNIPDFLVEVETGRNPVVLQLTDIQIVDAAQARLGREGVHWTDWATDKMDVRCYNYLTEIINSVKPDLILMTGDNIYGEFDDNGTVLKGLVRFMESFQIPWAPIFGNHDNESKMGADWQSQQFEDAEYCLFEQKTLTGNGNYSVGLAQGNELKRVFYMLDSNGGGNLSEETLANGHSSKIPGFGADQIAWYTEQITALKAVSPDTKISFAWHIPSAIFVDAYKTYGFTNNGTDQNPINIDKLADKKEGDFGYLSEDFRSPWDTTYSVYNGLKKLGVDSIFVGHDHCNSASVVYDGVRFQYGQKSTEYDMFNTLMPDGTFKSTRLIEGTPLIGGTVLPLSEEDGSIVDPYIYYCGDPFGTNR